MTPTRISKIARLPFQIREQLNRRLFNGEIGRTLLKWLNNLPETKEVMNDLFNSKPITHQNLSEWRRAGYQDWLMHQHRIEWFKNLTEEESEISKHDHCNDTFEAMSNYFIFELGKAITSLQKIKDSPERLDRLESLTREFARLQNSFNWSRRVELEWCKHNGTREPEPTHDSLSPNSDLRPPTSDNGGALPSAGTAFSSPEQKTEVPEQEVIEIQPEPTIPQHHRTGAVQDAPHTSDASNQRESVLDCGSPLSLLDSNSQTPSSTPPPFQPIPTPAPTTTPNSYLRTPNSQRRYSGPPLRGRRFVCIEG